MPLANQVGRPLSAIRVKLPTKTHPHLKRVVHELDFACSTCSSAHQRPTYRTFMECYEAGTLQPISGIGDKFTRFGLLCPECYTAPEEGPFIQNGVIDLEQVPPAYKRPERPLGTDSGSLFDDDDEEAPVLKPQPAAAPRGPAKKTSDLNPKTRGAKLKGSAKAAAEKAAGKSKQK